MILGRYVDALIDRKAPLSVAYHSRHRPDVSALTASVCRTYYVLGVSSKVAQRILRSRQVGASPVGPSDIGPYPAVSSASGDTVPSKCILKYTTPPVVSAGSP